MNKLILVVVLSAAGALLAFGPMDRPRGQWWENEKAVAELGLTPDQQVRLDRLSFEHRSRMIDLRADLEKAQLRLQELMDDPRFEERAALEQSDRVTAARSLVEKERAALLVKTRAVLTAEQWRKAKARLQEKRHERREGFREERREHRRDRLSPPPMDAPGTDEY